MNQPQSVDSLEAAMRLAIEHSYLVKGATYPNPPVGAVIVDPEGRVVGVGATEPAGGDHAEVVALRRAGRLAAGGIAVVTLEPCNHYGKTPPCVNALLEARVGTVIYAVADPNAIAGGGSARLSGAGVNVRSGVLADQVAAGPLREWLPPMAPASGSPARSHARICIVDEPPPMRSWSAPAPCWLTIQR